MAEPPSLPRGRAPMGCRPPMSCRPRCRTRNRTSGCRTFGYCPPWWCWPGRSSQSSEKIAQGTSIEIGFRTADDLEAEQDEDPLQSRGNRRGHGDSRRQGSQTGHRHGEDSSGRRRLSRRRHPLLGGAAARDRGQRHGSGHARVGRVHRRRRGSLERQAAHATPVSRSAGRDFRLARPSKSYCTPRTSVH